MIIAKPVGGLANQMGVYAAAKALAVHHNVRLKLDLRAAKEGTLIEYRLNRLNVDVEIATPEEISAVLGATGISLVDKAKKKLHKKFGLATWGEYKEKTLDYDPDFFNLPADQYLAGNFPSICYYKTIDDFIRKEFTVKDIGNDQTKAWENKILAAENSVCLHIRRGDYKNSKTQAFHGLLEMDYFEKGISHMEKVLGFPEFFVFSDEIEWVKDHLTTTLPIHYVDCHTPYDGHLDFRLMQKCRHFVISNSGFSRWAAYLSDSENKVVCMPKQWFVNDIMNDADIAPMDWVRL